MVFITIRILVVDINILSGSKVKLILLTIFKTLIMKNLKIKLGLFSLLTILAVSVFFTSCEQEYIVAVPVEGTAVEDSRIFKIPDEYLDVSQNELDTFIKNLSATDLDELELVSPVSNQTYLENRGCSIWYNILVTCCWTQQRRWCATSTSFWYEYRIIS